MNWIYIMHNPKTDRFYIGSTIDLERRLRQHLSHNVKTTRRLGMYELVYTEEFSTIEEARSREKRIKSWKSKVYIKKLIEKMGKSKGL